MIVMIDICMLCEAGELHRVETLMTMNLTTNTSVVSVYLECDNCGSEVATSEEVLENKKAILEYYEGRV